MKQRVLLIQPEFDLIAPRTIRISNLLKFLKNDFEVHLLKVGHPIKERSIDGITIHNVKIGRFKSNFINYKYNTGTLISPINLVSKLTAKFFKKYIYFPDIWISSHKEIYNYLLQNSGFKFDVVIASIYPFSNARLINTLISKQIFSSSKIVFDIGDPLSNNAADLKQQEKKKKYEKKYLTIADRLIVTNELTKIYYKDSLTFDVNNISVIPQGVSIELFSCKNPIPELKNTIRLCYAGVFYEKLRSPEKFFLALNKLNGDLNFDVSLYGSNIKPNIDSVSVYPKITQEKLVEKYADSHVLLFFDNAFGIQLSGKIFELLSTNRPILFIYDNPKSEALKIVKDLSHVIKVKNTINDIYNILLSLKHCLETIGDINSNADLYSWKLRAKKFKNLLLDLD